jgi:hypothetical protein
MDAVKETSGKPRVGDGTPGPGRPKGVPNKATTKCRETIALIADEMADEFKLWVQRTADGDPESGAKPDPKGAAELYLKAIEYHIPKLARSELSHSGNVTLTHEQWLDSLAG